MASTSRWYGEGVRGTSALAAYQAKAPPSRASLIEGAPAWKCRCLSNLRDAVQEDITFFSPSLITDCRASWFMEIFRRPRPYFPPLNLKDRKTPYRAVDFPWAAGRGHDSE